MQKALMLKALATAALALLLLWPLAMIEGVVAERQFRQQVVQDEIQEIYAGRQRLLGPVLVLPYREEYTAVSWESVGEGLPKVRREKRQKHEGVVHLLPKALEIQAEAPTSFKYRGLFRVPIYRLEGRLTGRFELPANPPLQRHGEDSTITWGNVTLALPIDDPRGLARPPRLQWPDEAGEWRQGTGIAVLPNGIHAPLAGVRVGEAQRFEFRLDLALNGSGELGFVPLAGHTRVTLDSGWPHPSFNGRFLPDPGSQRVSEEGFHAEWEVTELATRAPQSLLRALSQGHCEADCLEGFGVRLLEPVNVYSMAERALKYAFLFVGLGFAAFFLFEQLTGMRIHPVQYLLVGLALALFFLLLLSLSEHLPFGLAYLLAGGGATALLGYYLSHVTGGVRRGLGFAAVLGGLFAALYGLLVSEDNALLMGSLLLFGLLALAMVTTRRFDWYALPAAGEAAATE